MHAAESEPLQRPALRPLRAEPATVSGRRGVVLVDPTDLAEPAFVPLPLVRALAMCTGRHEVPWIARASRLPEAELRAVLAELDRRLLLAGPRFAAARDRVVTQWLAGGVRESSHVGSAGYPGEAGALRAALATMVPGAPAGGGGARSDVRGLIAPHIDLERGAAGYAAAYGALLAAPPADLYVVFGTGHQGPSAPVTGLGLDFATPLGRARTDRAFVDAVHAAIGAPSPEDLLLHRGEHSIEFQVLLLQHVAERRGGADFAVAPFLCGALPSADGDPTGEAWLLDLVAAFRAAVAASGKRVCFVAGADLAHVGPFFGDERLLDAVELQRLARDERDRLAHLQRGEPGAFHAAVARDANPDRVCSAPAITLTALLAGGPWELVHYGQAAAADGSQCVSFCAAAAAGG